MRRWTQGSPSTSVTGGAMDGTSSGMAPLSQPPHSSCSDRCGRSPCGPPGAARPGCPGGRGPPQVSSRVRHALTVPTGRAGVARGAPGRAHAATDARPVGTGGGLARDGGAGRIGGMRSTGGVWGAALGLALLLTACTDGGSEVITEPTESEPVTGAEEIGPGVDVLVPPADHANDRFMHTLAAAEWPYGAT